LLLTSAPSNSPNPAFGNSGVSCKYNGSSSSKFNSSSKASNSN